MKLHGERVSERRYRRRGGRRTSTPKRIEVTSMNKRYPSRWHIDVDGCCRGFGEYMYALSSPKPLLVLLSLHHRRDYSRLCVIFCKDLSFLRTEVNGGSSSSDTGLQGRAEMRCGQTSRGTTRPYLTKLLHSGPPAPTNSIGLRPTCKLQQAIVVTNKPQLRLRINAALH